MVYDLMTSLQENGMSSYRRYKKSGDHRIGIHLKLDSVICIVVAMWNLSIILFGVDEGFTKNEDLLIFIANIQIYSCMISFTNIFLAWGWKGLQILLIFCNYKYKKIKHQLRKSQKEAKRKSKKAKRLLWHNHSAV